MCTIDKGGEKYLLQRLFRVSLSGERAIAFLDCSRMEEPFRSLSGGRVSFVQKLVVVSGIRGGFRVSRASFRLAATSTDGNVFADFDSVATTISITLGCRKRGDNGIAFLSLSLSLYWSSSLSPAEGVSA